MHVTNLFDGCIQRQINQCHPGKLYHVWCPLICHDNIFSMWQNIVPLYLAPGGYSLRVSCSAISRYCTSWLTSEGDAS